MFVRTVGPMRRRLEVERPHDIVLFHLGPAPQSAGMRADIGVNQRVDPGRIKNASDQGVADIGAHELKLADGNRWLLKIDADDRFDLIIVLETFREPQTHMVRNPGDEDALALTHSSLVSPRPVRHSGLYPTDGPTMIVEPAAA